MPDISIVLIIVLILILWGEFVNGWNDSANAIATVVSTRVLSPFKALMMATVLDLCGVLLGGTAVAMTIGKGIIDPSAIGLTVLAAAMISIIIFTTVATCWGLPISISHALVSGLAGAGLAKSGPSVLLWTGWKKVIIGLGFSTFAGFTGGFILMALIYLLFRRAHLGKVRGVFGKLQIVSSAFMAFSHGTNDGQKTIGVFTLALVMGGLIPMGDFRAEGFHIPLWIILVCALTMASGTAIGGWKVIKTMGLRMTKLEPVQGFAAETGAAMTILIASITGIPLSTTHTISTSIMGVGSSKRFSAVRWGITANIVTAWLLTFPCCALISFIATKIVMCFG